MVSIETALPFRGRAKAFLHLFASLGAMRRFRGACAIAGRPHRAAHVLREIGSDGSVVSGEHALSIVQQLYQTLTRRGMRALSLRVINP